MYLMATCDMGGTLPAFMVLMRIGMLPYARIDRLMKSSPLLKFDDLVIIRVILFQLVENFEEERELGKFGVSGQVKVAVVLL